MNQPDDGSARLLRIGPASFHLRTPFPEVMEAVRHLYRDYPDSTADGIFDFAVGAVPDGMLRQWLRPKFRLACDFEPFETLPMPRRLGLLGFEMGMNLQMAAGWRRHIVLHAAAAARDDRAVMLIGDSGAGKSTLSALLSWSGGWRHFGDEFALLDIQEARLHPYPRPISLKNDSIAVMEARAPADRFGPRLENTVKGTIRHLLPPREAIAAMDVPAPVAMVIAPRFAPGTTPQWRPMTKTETYVRLAASSTNQTLLGEAGFEAVRRCLDKAPAFDLVYGSSEGALELFKALWEHVSS